MSPLITASLVSLSLALIKLAVFFTTNSVVILASFFDSLVDSLVSFANYRVEKFARQAPDRGHPFGHGGFEVISSLVQGFIISISGLFLTMQGVQRLFSGRVSLEEGTPLLFGAGVLLLSAIAGAFLARHLTQAEHESTKRLARSLSLSADKGHYVGDFLSSLAGAIGLVLVWFTHWAWLDSLFGIVGAIMLVKVSIPIIRKSIRDIVHAEIDPDLQKKIVEIIMGSDERIRGVHRLRSRGLGPSRFVDFHLKLPTNLTLEAAHAIGEKVTRQLKQEIPHIDVLIHLDPASEPDDELWKPSYR